MNPMQTLGQIDWWSLLSLLIGAVAALICIVFHELAHGVTAYHLGDPTAKTMGRLTLNPLKHIDPIGLLMMVVAKVGWAKAVPVDMRNFKHPKRDMAITALAGPISNFVIALIAMLICSLIYHFSPVNKVILLVLCFLSNITQLSVGLGIFNLFPISPLDGSKVLFALLPDKLYYTVLRYERYVMIVIVLLVFFGVLSPLLSYLIAHALFALSTVTGFPIKVLWSCLDVSWIFNAI